MNDSNPLIDVRDLKKTYRSGSGSITVLDGLDCSVQSGSAVVIQGESGCGKSTLLQLVGGLDRPDSGFILYNNSRIDNLSEKKITRYRNRTVGFVFQLHNLLKEFTALENVLLPAMIAGKSRRSCTELGRELLDGVGLADRARSYPSQLSGGERQRIAVARALINAPELILADEPTGSLDERNSAVVEEMLFNLIRKFGATMILVTHDLRLASLGDLSLTLRQGRLWR